MGYSATQDRSGDIRAARAEAQHQQARSGSAAGSNGESKRKGGIVSEIKLSRQAEQELREQLCPDREKASGDIRIVILQRGWVMVGRYSESGDQCPLTDAAVVRVWGTTKGLPEIAQDGPTSKTVLDKSSTVRFHKLTVIATIDCVARKWQSRL